MAAFLRNCWYMAGWAEELGEAAELNALVRVALKRAAG